MSYLSLTKPELLKVAVCRPPSASHPLSLHQLQNFILRYIFNMITSLRYHPGRVHPSLDLFHWPGNIPTSHCCASHGTSSCKQTIASFPLFSIHKDNCFLPSAPFSSCGWSELVFPLIECFQHALSCFVPVSLVDDCVDTSHSSGTQISESKYSVCFMKSSPISLVCSCVNVCVPLCLCWCTQYVSMS